MRRVLSLLLVLAAALLFHPLEAIAQPPDFVELSTRLKPVVVNISTAKMIRPQRPFRAPGQDPRFRSPQDEFFEDFFERFFQGQPQQPRKERSLGSGFIISRDGFVLTNAHVVEGADEVKVTLSDGRSITAEVRGIDPKLDIGLLKINAGDNLPVAELGDSGDLKVGEWVLAIGNPFGLEETVTAGIVSAKERVIGAGPYDEFIQTDASINPGNSGGPLFNIKGKVVGINTAIVAGGQGIGFATPINAAKLILPELRKTGHVTRGWLGVGVQQLTEELAASFGLKEAKGALVSEVMEGSPAAAAGIKRGDILLAYGGRAVEQVSDLPRAVAATPVGQKVPVKIFRGGKTMEVQVTVAKLEEEMEPQAKGEGGGVLTQTLGITVGNVTAEAIRFYDLPSDKGALVAAVDPAGPAAESGLRPGDLIEELNGKEVTNAAAFRAAVEKISKGQSMRLLVRRGKEGLFYTALTKP